MISVNAEEMKAMKRNIDSGSKSDSKNDNCVYLSICFDVQVNIYFPF